MWATKAATHRVAVASGRIRMRPATFRLVAAGKAKKGDVLGVARIAAVQAAKRAAELIPLAHPISLTRVAVDSISTAEDPRSASPRGSSAAARPASKWRRSPRSVGLLTIYDMVKAVDRGMTLTDLRLDEKHGGKSGVFRRTAR